MSSYCWTKRKLLIYTNLFILHTSILTAAMIITYKPASEIVIHNLRKHELDSFINAFVLPNGSPVGWCEGILLFFRHYPLQSELLIEESLRGVEHIGGIEYCIYPTYSERLQNKKLNCEILVINHGKDSQTMEIIKIIQEIDKK